MQNSIASSYDKYLKKEGESLETMHKLRTNYVLARIKGIDMNNTIKSILACTERGQLAIVLISIPTLKRHFLTRKVQWEITRTSLMKILKDMELESSLQRALNLKTLGIDVSRSKLRGHEYHEHDIRISWSILDQCTSGES